MDLRKLPRSARPIPWIALSLVLTILVIHDRITVYENDKLRADVVKLNLTNAATYDTAIELGKYFFQCQADYLTLYGIYLVEPNLDSQ